MPSKSKTSSISFSYYTSIFTISLATIAVQILFSRIFSVTLLYHFAFAGITFAMLGITVGALKVYSHPDKFSADRASTVLAGRATNFAASLIAAVLFHVFFPGIVTQMSMGNSGAYISFILVVFSFFLLLFAFIQSGICIALLLTRFPNHTGKLYAFDLGGAALGCIVVIAALKILDPIGALLLIALAVSITAWQVLPKDAERRLRGRVKFITVTLVLMSILQLLSYWQDAPVFRLLWAKHTTYNVAPLFERWNTYSRVVVTDYDSEIPAGAGFGERQTARVSQKNLTIDADAATILTAFNGNLQNVSFLKNDIVNLGYHVRPINDVAVIGVGGGRDILSALAFGAKHIRGIEMNPAIFEALTKMFGDFTGHLDRYPQVALTNAEARSYLSSHQDNYDLIQISLIDTWATTAAGGLTLAENKLYTTNAWSDFLDRLNDTGLLVVTRWYDSTAHPGEFYRLLAIASDVLKSRDPNADPRQHILVANVNKLVTVIVSKSPLTEEEIARFMTTCQAQHFMPLLTPHLAADETAARIASGANSDFFTELPLDVTASTDDKPFFFYMLRLSSLLKGDISQLHSMHANKINNAAVLTLAALFFFTLIVSCIFIIPPMTNIYRTHHIHLQKAVPYMLYFAGIGLGFMFIEISQMQRLMIFLGHPVYGLSVVLFALLLSSSLGSYLQQRIASKTLWLAPAVLCLVLVITGVLTPLATEYLKYYDISTRILFSTLLIFPMGIAMGTMFPLGVTLAKTHHSDLLPWYWGINGTASVFASVFAVIVSLQAGISATFWAGVLCYALCLLVVIKQRENSGT
jgi:hypothetical protein